MSGPSLSALVACGKPGEPCEVVRPEVPPSLRAADAAEAMGIHEQATTLRRTAERITRVHQQERGAA
jgi:hypothetical protein